jgi:hypothetical protein
MTGEASDPQTPERIPAKEIWIRGLYMVLFFVIHEFVKGLVFLVAVFHFLAMLIARKTYAPLLRFSQGLATYLYAITLFLTFVTEEKPFPFREWPSGPPAPFVQEPPL